MSKREKAKQIPASDDAHYDRMYTTVVHNRAGNMNDQESLEQPSPYTQVETVTTYGPYQEPVR